jgi:hypothetical protein
MSKRKPTLDVLVLKEIVTDAYIYQEPVHVTAVSMIVRNRRWLRETRKRARARSASTSFRRETWLKLVAHDERMMRHYLVANRRLRRLMATYQSLRGEHPTATVAPISPKLDQQFARMREGRLDCPSQKVLEQELRKAAATAERWARRPR